MNFPSWRLVVLCAIPWLAAAAIFGKTETTVKQIEYVKQPTRTIVKEVRVPVNQPDGYVSEYECERLASGTTMHNLVGLYGWPADGDAGTLSYAGLLNYPVRDNHNDTCQVDMSNGKINSVAYITGN